MSDWPIVIRYEGKPRGKERPRFGKGNTYTPEKTKLYENYLKWLMKSQMRGLKPLEGPVEVNIVASFRSKKKGYHTIKPDADNLGKAACDAMNGVVYLDDSQIALLVVRKVLADNDFLTISVMPLTDMTGS